jgi:CheY-like chemotaxis protein
MGLALVVEDDTELRALVSLVLKEVLDEAECESAEAAVAVSTHADVMSMC